MKIAVVITLACVLGWAEDAKKLFEKKCSVCHASESDEHRIGPSLKGEKTRASHDVIYKKIEEGGNGMPVFRELLTKEQKEIIVAYVLTL